MSGGLLGYYQTSSVQTTSAITTYLDVWWEALNVNYATATANNGVSTLIGQYSAVWTQWVNQNLTGVTVGAGAAAAANCEQVGQRQRYEQRIEAVEAQLSRAVETGFDRISRFRIEADEADKKAEHLLSLVLSPQQREQYKQGRFFEVIVGSKRYRLDHGWAGNVSRLDDEGNPVERLCIHPAVRVPEADNLISQKLLLESDEAAFRCIANITRLRHAA